MSKRNISDPTEVLERLDRIKRLVIVAMFSDDLLMERLVLKGGNALDLVHRISYRASVDVDLSIEGDFTISERAELKDRIERALQITFRPEGFEVFDVMLGDQPKEVSAELATFWGGYDIEFKLIESGRYESLKNDVQKLRKSAIPLGQGTKFTIDISKHEYTTGKSSHEFDDFTIYVYTPEMIVCEKLRAICQQMPEYGEVVKRTRTGAARARDFVDIHSLAIAKKVDLSTRENRDLLARVFEVKRVKLGLLRLVGNYRDFHRTNFSSVVDTVNTGVVLEEFDFYVDFVLELIRQLEPLGDE